MPAKRPMKLDDLLKLRAVGKVALSPDASQVVYELKRHDAGENKNFVQLMLVDVKTRQTRPLTEGNHCDTLPQWSPDGGRLAFLSDRKKATCIYVLPMAGGEARRISDRDGHVKDFAWSPDGRRLAYTYQPMSERQKLERDKKRDKIKKKPEFKHITRLHHKLDGAGYWNGHYTHVFLISAEGGKPRQLSKGNYDDSEPRFSPDGKRVSFISNRVENPDLNYDQSDIYVARLSGGPVKKLTSGPGGCLGHSWAPDGKTIAYIGSPAKTGQWWKYNEHIWLVPASGGKPHELTREIDNHCLNVTLGDVAALVFEAVQPIWTKDSKRLYFMVSERGATHLYSRSIKRNDTRCEISGNVNVMHVQRTARSGPFALSLGTTTDPGDIHVADPDSGCKLTRLSSVNADVLDRIHVAKPEPFKVRSGKVSIQGWILKPPNFAARRKYPAILEIHGGPHGQYGASFFHEMQWLAAKGYVVAYSNPRGSAGYGLKFMNSIHADWGNLDYKDCTKVADYLFTRPYVDKKRVGVTGGSYGGYMTNWLVGHTDRFKAAVTQRSVVNCESFYGSSDFGYDLGHELGGSPFKDVDNLRRQSPLTFVKNIKTPLLIIHSEQDLRCPVEQADELFTCLKVLGRTTELVRFEGESHGLSRGGRPQNRLERLKRILAWFDRYLK